MGGSLYVSSQPMVGTTFSFTLPLATEEEIKATQTLAARGHFQIPEANLENTDDLSLPENPDGPLLYVADDEPVTYAF